MTKPNSDSRTEANASVCEDPAHAACRLTGSGRSAVAVVAARGPETGKRLAALFQSASGRDVASAEIGDVLFGVWRTTGEELVVCRAPEQWEVHCHGGVAAAAEVLRNLAAVGFAILESECWQPAPERSSTVNAALQLLGRAETPRVAGMLLSQVRGAWDDVTILVNAAIDAAAWPAVARHVGELESRIPWGSCLERPWQVVLCGAPNAGKSTLLNALVGYERAVVWDRPGTTRDSVFTTTVLDGWPVSLCDTAGIRETDDVLEQAGGRRAKRVLAAADLMIEVVDLSCPQRVEELLPDDAFDTNSHIRIGAKLDLIDDGDARMILDRWRLDTLVSAETGAGLEDLKQLIISRLAPCPAPHVDVAIPFLDEHICQLRRWREKLDRETSD